MQGVTVRSSRTTPTCPHHRATAMSSRTHIGSSTTPSATSEAVGVFAVVAAACAAVNTRQPVPRQAILAGRGGADHRRRDRRVRGRGMGGITAASADLKPLDRQCRLTDFWGRLALRRHRGRRLARRAMCCDAVPRRGRQPVCLSAPLLPCVKAAAWGARQRRSGVSPGELVGLCARQVRTHPAVADGVHEPPYRIPAARPSLGSGGERPHGR
jgi:hypothetical protein